MSGKERNGYSLILNIIVWGALWGIFEATVGYLLHLASFGYSWIIWYPFACFFLMNTYRKTGRISAVFYVGLLCASIKMLNLFLPGRIDKVISPAISIVFESLAMAAIVFLADLFMRGKHKNPFIKALVAFSMNTGWRLLFVLYLLFLVPGWIRDVSVISSPEKFIPFFVTQNLITSALIFIGYLSKAVVLKPIELAENRLSGWLQTVPKQAVPIMQTGLASLLLLANIALQFLLK
jgi:hypothetical protein